MSWFEWCGIALFTAAAGLCWAACFVAGRMSREEEKEDHERNRS
jgi:hypothetical protein